MADIFLGFGESGFTPNINYTPSSSSHNEPTRLSLVDSNGAATQVEFSITATNGIRSASRGLVSGFPEIPDELKSSEFYTTTDDATKIQFTFWNMPAGYHELKIMSRRERTDDRTSYFTFGTAEGSVNATYNTAFLILPYMATEGEDVTLDWWAATSQFGYMNAALLVLGDSDLQTPKNLSTNQVTNSLTRLLWERG